jgi:Yip1 domain
VSTRAAPTAALERAWWHRTFGILHRPAEVFAALRDEPFEDAAPARSEPMLAIAWLAGIAAVLESSVGVHTLDAHVANGVLWRVDELTFAVWVFLAGGAYGFVAYWLLGAAVYLGARGAGSLERYRLARHVVVWAAAPVALSLLVWPVRLAVYGGAVFRSGGSDSGTPNAVFGAVEACFGAWALVLLLVGIRTVYGFAWPRALAALSLGVVMLGLFALIPVVL